MNVFHNWPHFKNTIYLIFLASILGIALFTFLCTYFFTRYKLKKEIKKIAYSIDFMHEPEESISLPSKYREVEKKLNKNKALVIKNARQAEETEQKKNDLLVFLAHDLKTPLTSIIGYLNLLLENPELTIQERSQYTKIALDKAYHLESLLEELFDITKLSNRDLALHKEKIDFTLFLEQIGEEMFPFLSEKEKKISLSFMEKFDLEVDPNNLARAFTNLLKNAITYSLPRSTIYISVQKKNGFLQVEIKNESTEIDPSALDHLFDKFYRLDQSRSTHTGGTGLGLAIAKEIIEMHGGTIRVSMKENWITFMILFPYSTF